MNSEEEDWFGHQARRRTEGQLRRSLDGTADLTNVRAGVCVCICVSVGVCVFECVLAWGMD